MGGNRYGLGGERKGKGDNGPKPKIKLCHFQKTLSVCVLAMVYLMPKEDRHWTISLFMSRVHLFPLQSPSLTTTGQ